jgi:hypothetical protein
MSDQEIKDCPFCGVAATEPEEGSLRDFYAAKIDHAKSCILASGFGDMEDEGLWYLEPSRVAAWNTRVGEKQ